MSYIFAWCLVEQEHLLPIVMFNLIPQVAERRWLFQLYHSVKSHQI